jgi:hypothetical protein
VGIYRNLSRKDPTNDEEQATWPRQLNVKIGNGMTPHVD